MREKILRVYSTFRPSVHNFLGFLFYASWGHGRLHVFLGLRQWRRISQPQSLISPTGEEAVMIGRLREVEGEGGRKVLKKIAAILQLRNAAHHNAGLPHCPQQ